MSKVTARLALLALTITVLVAPPTARAQTGTPDLDELQHKLDQLKADKRAKDQKAAVEKKAAAAAAAQAAADKAAADQAAASAAAKAAEEKAAAEREAAEKLAHERAIRQEKAEMLVIPAGRFEMGDDNLAPSTPWSPVHSVSVRSFVLAKYDVTFDDWDACVAAGGCNNYRPDDNGWGRSNRPVINVSYDDAQAYIRWYSAETGHEYRLPTEAEWEYAVRAKTSTNFYWGNKIGRGHAVCSATSAVFEGCGSQWDGKSTTPVGYFAANPWGLFDMVGNVSQWTDDCQHWNYEGAPADGTAWNTGDCSLRAVRGGSWRSWKVMSYIRDQRRTGDRGNDLGFRLARSLP